MNKSPLGRIFRRCVSLYSLMCTITVTMANEDLDKQIPTRDNLDRTEKVLQRQDSVPGQKRDDELVHNFPQAASLAQALKGLKFPADKIAITRFVEERHSKEPETREVLKLVEKIPGERQYNNVFEVAEAAKLIDISFS
jgi:hypothetical protein